MIRGHWLRRRDISGATALFVSAAFGLLSATSEAQAPPTAIGSISATQTATVTITTAGTLSIVAVLTQGATGLDYKVSPSGTCTTGTAYNVGDTCTVQYTFAPTLPNARYGGISLSDATGKLLGNLYLVAFGAGPQVIFPPTSTTIPAHVATGQVFALGIAVDGNGNVYYADPLAQAVKEIVAVGGVVPANPTIKTIASGFIYPYGVALDGSGNLFVSDNSAAVLKEIVAVGGVIPSTPTVLTVASGFSSPTYIAVDGFGNVFVADNQSIKKVGAASGVIPANPMITTLASVAPASGIAVDPFGDVFFTNGASEIDELVAGGGPTPQVVITGISANGIALDNSGNLYAASPTGKMVSEILAVGGVIPANPTVQTIGTGYTSPFGITVDNFGNIFVADYNVTTGSVLELGVLTPQALTFTSTTPPLISADSPQTVTVYNSGNTPLIFATPASGSNPTIPPGFLLGGGNTGGPFCPLVTTTPTGPTSLGAGTSCVYSVSFGPPTAGPMTGTLIVTDNSLNATAATQSISVAGGVSSPAISVTNLSNPVNTAQVTLTANIAYIGATPTGAVNFSVNSGAPITAACTGSSSPLVCTATYNSSTLTVGSYPIVATLSPDISTNTTTGSGTLAVTVGTPTVALSSSNASVPVDTPITFTATVTPNTGVTPLGPVAFTAMLGGSAVALPNCSSQPLVAGVATCSANNLVAGSYTVTATLAADTNFISATDSMTQTITMAMPAVSVSSSNASLAVDTPFTLTATVTPNSGITPTGPVAFTAMLNGSPVALSACTSVSLVSGATLTASCPVNNLPMGSYAVTATLTTDANFFSASGGTTQTITPGTPVVTLNTSNPSTTVNQLVTLTATVTPNAGVLPGGAVSFSTTLNNVVTPISNCSSVALSGLTATCNTSLLLASSNSITATIAADANFIQATSIPVTQTVALGTPVLTLITSNASTSVDQGVQFMVTVTPNTGIVPVGTVSFSTTLNNTTTVISACSSVPLSGFTAACSTSTLLAGPNSITATIVADNNFAQAASNAVTQTVAKASTTLLVTSSSPISSTVDTAVTLTATLSGLFPFTTAPTGTVAFTANGVPIANCATQAVTSGTATCTTSALVAPADTIVATYNGDINFTGSSSSPITQNVAKNVPGISASSSAPTAVVNQVVTFTATITPSGASSLGVSPAGSVTFIKGGLTVCGPAAVTAAAGGTATATCSASFNGVFATTNITATYSGDSNFTTGTGGTVAQTILASQSVTTASSNLAQAAVNQNVILSATFGPTSGSGFTGTATPQSGSVSFADSLAPATSPFCVTAVTGGAPNPVTCPTVFTVAGNHLITTTFTSTDPNFNTSSGNVTVTVTSVAQTLIFNTPSPANPTVNQAVTLSASFLNTGGATATGTYAYTDSFTSSVLGANCSGTVTAVTSIPSCTDLVPASGVHVITLTFTAAAGSGFASTTSSSNLVVGQNTPTVAVTSPTTGTTDLPLTFIATVIPSTTTPASTGTTLPSGFVTFTRLVNSVATPICTATVTSSTGIATCLNTVPITAVGTYQITATYSGDANFASAPSVPSVLVIAQGGTTLAYISPTNPALPTVNQSAIYTVQFGLANSVSDAGLTAPTGNIIFYDQSNPTVPLCAVAAPPNGPVSCSFALLTAGAHALVAKYAGDTNFTGSTTPFNSPSIQADATTTTVGSNLSQAAVNQTVILTASFSPFTAVGYTVTPATPQSGTVTFTDSLGTGNLCPATAIVAGSPNPVTCSPSFTTTGSHVITATFTSTDSNFTTSSGNVTVTVTSAAQTISFNTTSPASPTVNQAVTISATFGTTNGAATGTYSYTDSFSSSVLAGCSGSLTNATAIPACIDTVLAAGTHAITVNFTAGTNSGFATTSSVTPLTVLQTATNVAVTPPPSAIVGQIVTFTAAVTPRVLPANPVPAGTMSPTGTVTFTNAGVNLCSPVPVTAVAGGTATASCSTFFSSVSPTPNIVATYNADSNYSAGISSPASVTVTASPSVTTVASNLTQVAVNSPVTLSASLGRPTGFSGPATPQAGTVTFTDAGAQLCPPTVIAAGVPNPASCQTSFTTTGNHVITATLVTGTADPNFLGSSSTVTVNVTAAAQTLSVTDSSPTTPATVNQPVKLSATFGVTNGATAVGTYAYTDSLAGSLGANCSGLVTAGLIPDCIDTVLVQGTHVITVTFTAGTNSGFQSTAPTHNVSVGLTAINVVITAPSSPASSVVGTAVTFLATVTPAVLPSPAPTGIMPPTGTVTFFYTTTGSNIPAAVCTAPTVAPAGSGTGTATCSGTFPNALPYRITAVYNGDTNFSPSSPSPATTLAIGKIKPPPLTLGSNSVANTVASQTVTYTALVTNVSNGAAPTVTTGTGTFSFTFNPSTVTCVPVAPVANSGTVQESCIATIPNSVSGSITLTAIYNGDKNYLASDPATLTQTIQNFTPAVNPLQFTMARGSSAFSNTNQIDPYLVVPITITANSQSGFIDPVQVTNCAVLNNPGATPATGLSCSAPNSTTNPNTAIPVIVTATQAAALGKYTVILTLMDTVNQGLTQTASTTVTIVDQPAATIINSTVGSTATATFSLPSSTVLSPTFPLSCNTSVSTYDPTSKTYKQNTTLAAIGLQCSNVPTAANSSNAYTFTFTTIAHIGMLRQETGVYLATLGMPFLLLFGLLPRLRKSRKGLLAVLSILAIAVGLLPVTGCGGGGFTPTPTATAVSNSYLISISDANGKTVAEVPVVIGSF